MYRKTFSVQLLHKYIFKLPAFVFLSQSGRMVGGGISVGPDGCDFIVRNGIRWEGGHDATYDCIFLDAAVAQCRIYDML